MPIFTRTSQNTFTNEPNVSISAFRLLFIFRLLCQSETLSLLEVNQSLMDNHWINRTFTAETLRKYFYTLNRIQCTIQTQSRGEEAKYRLTESAFKIAFNDDELAALQTILKWLYTQPIKHDYEQLNQFIQWISVFSETGQNQHSLSMNHLIHPSSSDIELQQKIAQFEKYCFDAQIIEVISKTPIQADENKVLVEPHQVRYHAGKVLLLGCEQESRRKISIELSSIHSARQLPNRSTQNMIQTLVTFKLTNRVAKNYRPYAQEIILDKGDYLLVKQKTDDVKPLLWRLLKYGKDCEILSPDSVRQDMQNTIESYIKVLNKPIDETLLQGLEIGQQPN